MDNIIERIMNSDNWPNLEMPENLEILNDFADELYSKKNFSGQLSAILMYHQIIEAMCIHLLEDCHFQIQLSLYPTTIQFSIPQNKMLGNVLTELKNSIDFHKKEEFLDKVKEFNIIRNETIHKMRKNNLLIISNDLKKSKNIFDEIYDLYDEIQDNFRVIFHDFKKDVFIDYVINEEFDEYS